LGAMINSVSFRVYQQLLNGVATLSQKLCGVGLLHVE
jgi:hypothetical protein